MPYDTPQNGEGSCKDVFQRQVKKRQRKFPKKTTHKQSKKIFTILFGVKILFPYLAIIKAAFLPFFQMACFMFFGHSLLEMK